MESMTGRLLVATPALKDPNFDRTVVLLVAHEPGGALGVVLNRATEVPVAEVLGDWSDLARHPAVLFEGGPVQPDSAICLARMRHPMRRLKGFHQVSGAVGTVDLSVDPERLRESIGGIRVFAGYSGWGTRPAGAGDRGRVLVRPRRAARRPLRRPARRPVADGAAPAGRHDGRGRPLPAGRGAQLSPARRGTPRDDHAGRRVYSFPVPGRPGRQQGAVAQLVAHHTGSVGVRGSSPLGSTLEKRPGRDNPTRAFAVSGGAVKGRPCAPRWTCTPHSRGADHRDHETDRLPDDR